MSLFSKNDEEAYEEDNVDGNIFARRDFQEWSRDREYAKDIESGLISGWACKDESVWNMVKEIEANK